MPRDDYEERQEQRRERLEARADKLAREGAAKVKSGMDRLRAIPFGQPILVGHHSENRDRNYRRKAGNSIDSGFRMQQEAEKVAARAESVGSGGISSDDPEAVAKLKAKLDNLEREQKRMVAINAAWRKAGKPKADNSEGWQKIADDPAVMMNVNDLSRVRADMARDFLDRAPFSYHLQNNNGNIKRIKDRIAHLERAATQFAETKETELTGGVKLVENTESNRVQLIFPGKPSEQTRSILKRLGFRWSPMEGAWQRLLNGSGVNAAKWAIEEIGKLPQND